MFFLRLSAVYVSKIFPYTTLFRSFLAITNFQKSLSNRCHRGYEDTIARIIREQLEVIFYKILLTQNKTKEEDRKSTRLNSSHVAISYAVYCLKKKNRHSI